MDLENRARSAAQGIHRAVEVMEMTTDTKEPRKVERFDQYQDRKNRNRRIGALVATAALVAVIALIGVNVMRPAGTGPAHTTILPGNAFMVDLDTGRLTPLPVSIARQDDEVAVSPLGTKIAYRSNLNHQIHLANADGTNDRIITPAGTDALGVQWSPDGSKLVYQRLPSYTNSLGNLYVYDVLTGTTRRITNLDQNTQWGWYVTHPSFSSGGSDVLYQLPRGNPNRPSWDLWSVPVAGGKPTLVRRDAAWGGYAPNDGRLAYLSSMDPQQFTGSVLWVATPGGAPPQALVRHKGMRWLNWSPDGTRIAYNQGNGTYVVDVSNGSITRAATGSTGQWVDNHTLVIVP